MVHFQSGEKKSQTFFFSVVDVDSGFICGLFNQLCQNPDADWKSELNDKVYCFVD